jgi:hypothetical protein
LRKKGSPIRTPWIPAIFGLKSGIFAIDWGIYDCKSRITNFLSRNYCFYISSILIVKLVISYYLIEIIKQYLSLYHIVDWSRSLFNLPISKLQFSRDEVINPSWRQLWKLIDKKLIFLTLLNFGYLQSLI